MFTPTSPAGAFALVLIIGLRAVALMIGVPQLIGFAASRIVGNRSARLWLGPIVAGTAFALGWWFWVAVPGRHAAAQGQRTCGAATAVEIVPLLFATPVNVVVGLLVQDIVSVGKARREKSTG